MSYSQRDRGRRCGDGRKEGLTTKVVVDGVDGVSALAEIDSAVRSRAAGR